jgi:putative Mg2+ transporter-C (MgtC) family protein
MLAALLWSVTGSERERLNWAAGLRTRMAVRAGSSFIALVSALGFSDVSGKKSVALNLSRIAAEVDRVTR